MHFFSLNLRRFRKCLIDIVDASLFCGLYSFEEGVET